MKKLLSIWRHKLVVYFFNRYYGEYLYGFKTADDRIEALQEPAKSRYYEDVTHWLNSEAHKIEYEGVVALHYEALAVRALEPDIACAHRLLLLALRNQEVRLKSKAEHYKQLNIIRNRSNQIK